MKQEEEYIYYHPTLSSPILLHVKRDLLYFIIIAQQPSNGGRKMLILSYLQIMRTNHQQEIRLQENVPKGYSSHDGHGADIADDDERNAERGAACDGQDDVNEAEDHVGHHEAGVILGEKNGTESI